MFRRFRGIGKENALQHMRSFVMRMHNTLKKLGPCPSPARSLAIVTALVCGATTVAAAPDEVGLWIDDTGKGAVQIDICGTKLCGRIVWLKDLVDKNGDPLTDKNNPDPGKQSRPICGLQILGGLQQMAEGGFDNGWVYDPKVGKAYSVAIELSSATRLKVTGYAGVKFLGKSFIWTRASGDLPSCEVSQAAVEKEQPAPAPAKVIKKPVGAKPDVAKSDTSKSDTPKSGAAKPGATTKAAVAKPTTAKAGTEKSATAKPSSAKKVASEELPWATTQKPSADKAAKPVAKSATSKPSPAKPAVE